MSEPLKPCPFCGCAAEIVTKDVEPQGDPWYGDKIETFPACTQCGCTLFSGEFHEGFYGAKHDPSEAIAAWNRRAPGVTREEIVEAIQSHVLPGTDAYGIPCLDGRGIPAAADAILALLEAKV